jgi:hypothetical protein
MTSSTITPMRPPRGALLVAAAWLGLAILAGATGALIQLPFPGTQLIIFTLVGATIGAALSVPALRAWVEALPLRALIGINAARFVGISFLVLAARGRLAPVFAARAGWGDIAVAIVALILVAAGDPRTRLHRGIVHVWNAVGALDLVVAIATATAITLRGSVPGIAPLLSLPLVVVPTFFVPLFLANHVVIFLRLRAEARAGHGR